MKVFAVFSGCYSYRGLDAIFSTKELAEKNIQKRNIFDYYGGVDKTPTEYNLDLTKDEEYVVYTYDNGKAIPYNGLYYTSSFNETDVSIMEEKNIIIKVHYNEDHSVMEKSAIDKYFIWKATKEGIS